MNYLPHKFIQYLYESGETGDKFNYYYSHNYQHFRQTQTPSRDTNSKTLKN